MTTPKKPFGSGSSARARRWSAAWVRARIAQSGMTRATFAARLGVSLPWLRDRARHGATALDAYAIAALAEGGGPGEDLPVPD